MTKLDVGCGLWPVSPEHVGVDAFEPAAAVQALMWDLPYTDNSIEEIYCSHALEHIGYRQVAPTLQEWRRVLAPSGLIILHVPDLIWCCQNFLEHPDSEFHLWTLFGQQNRVGEYHQTGFARAMMERYLVDAGLTLLEYNELETHAQKTMEFRITKR